jgi:hypothetical protein
MIPAVLSPVRIIVVAAFLRSAVICLMGLAVVSAGMTVVVYG